MSIFRETFPTFIQNELTRRQDGMLARTPAFLHQLNSRSAWVRMTSGVDYEGSSALAKNYVLQGGTLFYSVEDSKDKFSQRQGIGNSSATYSNKSITGESTTIKNRTGIRPMPGITNVNIQSKGAYGSLQEATVTFTCWDIRQLEELEILYMRPGYTVLLEFGWDFAKVNGVTPSYDILNKSDITLNDAFAQIYELIDQSGGTYDALLGYVKNYNWTARDDGGYDCTTSIISLGEVLESLKCNWVPGETIAFDNSGKGILRIPGNITDYVLESYEKGIIPGLLQELGNSMSGKPNGSTNVITDPNTGNYYYLYRLDIQDNKNERGGLTKNIAPNSKAEIYITLGSFCDLLSTYVFPKGAKNQPLSELVTYETDYKSKSYIKYKAKNTTNSKESLFASMPTSNAFATSLKCIASPLALSTNLGVCYVRNDNWNNLGVQTPASTVSSAIPIVTSNPDIAAAASSGFIGKLNRFIPKFKEAGTDELIVTDNPVQVVQEAFRNRTYYRYEGNLEQDFIDLSNELTSFITSITYGTDGVPRITFGNGGSFKATSSQNITGGFKINLLDLFYPGENNAVDMAYDDLFISLIDDYLVASGEARHPVKDNTNKAFIKDDVLDFIKKYFTNIPLDARLQQILNSQVPVVASQVSNAASNASSRNTLPFLETNDGSTKQLGYISNIYVNINYLYEQAISKNHASNDTQNKNTISIRDYIQSIMRDVQNSLGNVNNFDIQVDNRNAVGRIIDINFTGSTTEDLFLLQMHNLNSVVRDYKFSSKIFPEMGSIIAISAQDATGIGKLGYDNATLVAWNEGISDRLIPKKDFNSSITLNDPNKPNSPATFLLPFLTKMYKYFQYINGVPNVNGNDNFNYAYGGLDFAYRDFLANLDRFDPQNSFKTIIPTELTITLDGLGGIIIGNLFKINQDIIPKGYKNTGGRNVAYIVTRLGHQISGNDWTTELSAYPIVFENAQGTKVWKQWENQQYPGAIVLRVGNNALLLGTNQGASGGSGAIPPTVTASTATQAQKDAMDHVLYYVFANNGGAAGLCARYVYTIGKNYILALKNEPIDVTLRRESGNANTQLYKTALENKGYKQTYNSTLSKQQVITKLNTGPWNIGDIVIYYDPSNPTGLRHTQIYTGGSSRSGGYSWASSYSDNYTYNFIYNSASQDTTNFKFYVYTYSQ